MNAIVPIPKVDISIRVATMEDLAFLDSLQKKHSKALGYFPTKQFEGYIEMGAVLVAEEGRGVGVRVGVGVGSEGNPTPTHNPTPTPTRAPVGYIISRDRYLKRDELGVIYQLCVEPGTQRKLIGAALVKEVFERSAYGCRLYCCWCAQDLEANYFWESLGFVPIAFRGGSTGKKRVHIFWQRRIREGDTSTPWWFPAKTDAGAIRQDRLVFPIPPGLHWSDEMPVLKVEKSNQKQIEDSSTAPPAGLQPPPLPPPRRVQFGARPARPMPQPAPAPKKAKRPEKQPAERIDPKLIKAARELRDRYLEQVNQPGRELTWRGKYHVVRQIAQTLTAPPAAAAAAPKQLPEAA